MQYSDIKCPELCQFFDYFRISEIRLRKRFVRERNSEKILSIRNVSYINI